jgi:hypothetical protein
MEDSIMKTFRIVLPVAAILVSSLAMAGTALATTTASETLTAGTLGFVSAPANLTFPGRTLSGLDQTTSVAQAFDVGDATGSGSGWNITGTSTTFSNGSHALPTSATTIASAPAAPTCDASTTCTVGGATTVTYPYTLPAGASAPTATKLYNAPLTTGMGDQTVTPTWTLALPANAYSGTYTSTWTLSLVSGP